MTIALWPAALPPPEKQSWQKTIDDPRLKKRADSGPPGYRLRFSAVGRPVSLSFLVSRAKKAIFDRFYEDEIAFGSLPFVMPDPTTDGWSLLTSGFRPILTTDGRPLLLFSRWLCLIGDNVPADVPVGMNFRISFSMTVMP